MGPVFRRLPPKLSGGGALSRARKHGRRGIPGGSAGILRRLPTPYGRAARIPLVFPQADSCVLFGLATERDDDDRPLSPAQLSALDGAVQKAAARNVPALIFGHYALDGTVDVDWEHAFLGPQSRAVRAIFQKHGGKVAYFSGHIHRGLMKAPGGTFVKTGGVSYTSVPSLCHPDRTHYSADNADAGTGLLVELSDGTARVSGFDFSGGKRLPDFHWNI